MTVKQGSGSAVTQSSDYTISNIAYGTTITTNYTRATNTLK